MELHYRQNEVWQAFWRQYKEVNMKHMKSLINKITISK